MRLVPADLRYAVRRLAATSLLSLGAVLTLSLGIGSAVVMVDVLDRLLLRAPAHVSEPARVARVYVSSAAGGYMRLTGYATFEALSGLRDGLDTTATFFAESRSYGRGRSARRLAILAHSPGYFSVLGMAPRLGSWAETPTAPPDDAAVISHALWQQEFGGSDDVLGTPLQLGSDTYRVVAVAPRGFVGIEPEPVNVWLPLAPRARATYGEDWKTSAMFLRTIVRLRAGVSRERAGDMATAAYRAGDRQPWEKGNALVLGDVRPGRALGASATPRVEMLVAEMSMLVLLITCGNVANFLLVRGLRRDRELLVKTALGASRRRLLAEVMIEAAVLAAAAGGLALIIAVSGGEALRRLFLSPGAAIVAPLDGRLLALTLILSVTAAFLLGIVPALRLTARRAEMPGHLPAIGSSRVLDVFSGVQVALSLPMVVMAGLFVMSLWHARDQDFGMRTGRVVVVTTNLYELGRPHENHEAHRRMQARLGRLPQVAFTALVQTLPMRSMVMFPIEVPGKDLWKGSFSSDSVPGFNAVDPAFFTVTGMRLVHGRVFTDDENRAGGRPVAVISESMATSIWRDEAAVGKCFYVSLDGGRACAEIVGVVADARLHPSIRPTTQWSAAFYLPIEQAVKQTSNRALLVRTTGDPHAAVPLLRDEAQGAAPDLPFVDAYRFDEIFDAMLRPWRLGSTVFLIFGAVSLIIAAVGLAVVTAHAVARRTREMAIRSALGAEPRHLERLVLRRSLLVVGAGLIVGVGLAVATGRVVQAQLFDVTAVEPRLLGGAVLLLMLIGMMAAWIPARRAVSIEPVEALRAE